MSVGPTGSGVGGGGTTNNVAKFISSSAVGDSRITDDGTDITANSGAGDFEAGDTGFVGNGCQLAAEDSNNRVYLQANGNGNFIQTLTLQGGDTNGSASLVAQGPGGTQQWTLDAVNNLILVKTGKITPSANPVDLGESAAGFQQLFISSTITAGGTTGDQTINKSAGSVNIAAGQSAIVVTCDKCTANSIVLAVIATNDATAILKSVVPAAGSFTIRTTAAVTGETRVSFWVLNQ